LLQHTPLLQMPLAHWSATEHVVPLTWLPAQMPLEQLPLMH
jgi:hypothetical protein